MAEANGTHSSGWVDFTLAKSVSFDRVIEALGITDTLRRTGNEYRGICPFHGGTKDSFGFNTERGFKCHGCKRSGGNVLDFVNHKLFGGQQIKEAARWLVALVEMPPEEKMSAEDLPAPAAADCEKGIDAEVSVMTARDRAICRGVARYLASVFGAFGNAEVIERELSRCVSEEIAMVDRGV